MPKDNNIRPGICIGVPSNSGDKLGLGRMVCDVLSNLDFFPALVTDGDSDVLQASLLLLLGDCHSFNGFAELLNKYNGRRPTTVLWQIDPLPPPTLSKHAEHIGLAALSALRKRERSIHSKLLKACLPKTMRRRLKKAVYARIFRDFQKEITHCCPKASAQIDVEACRFVIRGYEWFKQHCEKKWLDYIVCTTPAKKEFLQSRGISAEYVPLGYQQLMGHNEGLERDIDVAFIGGTKNVRRRTILNHISRSLASRHICLQTQLCTCLGDERAGLLNRVRISINIASFPWDVAGLRFLISMACGALVVSEPLENPGPYKAGVHFIEANIDQIPEVIDYYLKNEQQRQAIVYNASQFINEQLTLQKAVLRILEFCYADTAVQTGNL